MMLVYLEAFAGGENEFQSKARRRLVSGLLIPFVMPYHFRVIHEKIFLVATEESIRGENFQSAARPRLPSNGLLTLYLCLETHRGMLINDFKPAVYTHHECPIHGSRLLCTVYNV